MNTNEKRKHQRIDSLNLSYLCVNENNEVVRQGMGRTLNVSESGILLETVFPIEKHHLLSLAIGFKDDVVDIWGKVIHCREGQLKRFETGIEFMEINEASRVILRRFIEHFFKYHQKREP